MPKESCGSCKFFMGVVENQGVCRRYPPTVLAHPTAVDAKSGQPIVAFFFPGMSATQGWCGEYQRALIMGLGGMHVGGQQ